MDKAIIKRSAFAAKQEKPAPSIEVRDKYYVPLWDSAEER